MGMSAGSSDGGPEMNITPLIDVALVVLIIFMVMVPTVTKTFQVNLPVKPDENAKPPPPSKKDPPVIITLRKDGTIWFNKKQLDKSTINRELPQLIAGSEKQIIYFDAHDDIEYGQAVQVLDLLRAAGAPVIAILTKKVVK